MTQYSYSKYPNILLETITYCNGKCLFCSYHNMTRKKGMMSIEMFHKIIDDIASWNYPIEIVPTMYGEFFLNPNWLHILQYINNTAPLVRIVIPTNGSVLDNDKIDEIIKIKNLKYIGLSVYAYYPETYQRLIGLPLETISKVENVVRRISKERPDIIMNIGTTSDEDYISKNELNMFIKKWEPLATPHEITRNAQHRSTGKTLSLNKNYECKNPCQTIFTSMVVQYNGDACICCYDSQGELNIGNVNERLMQSNHTDLLNIWNGKKAVEYRNLHANGQRDSIPLCRSCNSNCWKNQSIKSIGAVDMTVVEINNMDTFDLLFKDSNPKERRVFVDVGGYNGDTVTRALNINPNLIIVVIEPIKSLADIIQQRFQSNKNVTVVNKAVWTNKCNIQFNEYVGWANGLSTLQPVMTQLRPVPQFTNQILKYDVEADTLDNILSDLNINIVDYLKIDTEGSEEQVLAGFTKYHNDTRFHVEHHITNLSNILQKLQEIGVDIEKITVSRDCNIKEHVVGAVIGKFTKYDSKIPNIEKITVSHAGNSRIQYLIDRAIINKEKILNVGCTDNFMFRDTNLDVMNIDIIDEIPEAYKSKTKFQIANAHNLPFADNEFNCSILGEILEHVKDPIQVLREAKRVAKNVYLTVPNEYSWDKNLNPFQNPTHVRHYTYESLKEDLDKAYGKDNAKIIQYDGGGWSFFCAEYENNIINTEYKEIPKIKDTNQLKPISAENTKQELIITEGPIYDTTHPLSRNTLRIALISTSFFTLPPKGYSGLEQIVWDLAEALDELGHEVTIFGPEGSQSPKHGHLITTGPSVSTVNVNWFEEERKNYEIYKQYITPDRFDIIHGHTWMGFEYLLKISNPALNIVHSHHGGYSWTIPPPVPNNKPNLVAISNHMKNYTIQYFKQKGYNTDCRFVHNGIDLYKYPYQFNKTERLLFVGRLSTFKQPHLAVELARNTNHKLDIVGGTFVDSVDYVKQLDEMCKNDPNIQIFKDVTHEFKIEKMQNAKALIFPSKMNEPFGLVALEAMACGTPVVAMRDGAICEVVIHNETGFICDNMPDMIDALKNIHTIDPKNCRKRAEQLSRQAMAENYLRLYKDIINNREW